MASLDEMWSYVVKARAFNTCQRCGQRIDDEKHGLNTMANDPHHIFSRGKDSTKYDPDNGICLCRNCHNWAGDHPKECRAWIISIKGEEWYHKLKVKSLKIYYPPEQREAEKKALRNEYDFYDLVSGKAHGFSRGMKASPSIKNT